MRELADQVRRDTLATDSAELKGMLREFAGGAPGPPLSAASFQGAYLIVNAAGATAPVPTLQRLPTAAENRMPFRGRRPRAPRFAMEWVAVQGGSKQEGKGHEEKGRRRGLLG